MTEDESQIEPKAIADAWVVYWKADENSPEREANDWVSFLLFESVTVDNKPDLVWQFILEVYRRDLNDELISVLAAGPLEDLLVRYGPDYIDRIETLARQDLKFNHILGGVWKNTMPDDIWMRVEAARNKIW